MDVSRLLDDLNEAQRDAVTAPPGPTLILAGAGSCLLYTSDAADE